MKITYPQVTMTGGNSGSGKCSGVKKEVLLFPFSLLQNLQNMMIDY
ncbi:hypothetical protein [Dapis sp. BLCC M229]